MSLTLQILGASCAVPNPDRATSGYLLRLDDSTVLMECGHGAVGKLLRYGAVEALDAVVVSHMHPDHCFDLVALRNYIYCHGLPPVPLYLPANGRTVLAGIARGLQLGADYFEPAFETRLYDDETPFTVGTAEFRTMRTVHNTVAHALSVRAPDRRRLVFSSDTAYFTELASFAAGCDILLIEVTDPVTPDSGPRWHLCPVDAAKVINDAAPARSLLTHYVGAQADATLAEVGRLCPDSDVRLAIEGECHVAGG